MSPVKSAATYAQLQILLRSWVSLLPYHFLLSAFLCRPSTDQQVPMRGRLVEHPPRRAAEHRERPPEHMRSSQLCVLLNEDYRKPLALIVV